MSTITIPAQLVPYAREGAHSMLGHAAEAILGATSRPDRESDPSLYDEPIRQLDRARALLDEVGWRTTAGQAASVPMRLALTLREVLREQASLVADREQSDQDLADYIASLGRCVEGRR